MAFWDDAKKKMQNMVKPRQQEEQPVLSNRADGGFSGYQPKMNRRMDNAAQQTGYQPTGFQRPVQGAAPGGFEGMMPTGVDPSVMQQFQPVGGQTGQMPPQQQTTQPGMPPQQAQPRPQAAFQPQPGFQPPQPYQQPAPQQPQRPAFGQQPVQNFQQPPMQPQQAFQRGFTVPQPPVQAAPQQPVSQPESNTFFFPGDYQVDGNAYKLVFRVAQITGVPSCFRVIEFMYNNEAVIVNAEQITDLVEADRCMDLIFGAACAMKQRLMRVSGKQIYLITPPQVYVAPFENLRRAGMEDIDRRWPGALQMNMQPISQGMAQPQRGFGTAPQQQNDFAGGFGRRASRGSARPGDYTDYGGFGMKTR